MFHNFYEINEILTSQTLNILLDYSGSVSPHFFVTNRSMVWYERLRVVLFPEGSIGAVPMCIHMTGVGVDEQTTGYQGKLSVN